MNNPVAFVMIFATFFCHFPTGNAVRTTFTAMDDTSILLNPEKGFYHVLELYTSVDFPSSLTVANVQDLIKGQIGKDVVSIILVEIILDNFKTSNINANVIDKLSNVVFQAVRSLNLKCILRFAYEMNEGVIPQDATEAQVTTHINQLSPIIKANSDVIFVVQAGFIGTWGEWYASNNFASADTFTITSAHQAARDRILTILLGAVPTNRMVQLRTPRYKYSFCKTTGNLLSSQKFDPNVPCARIGIHNDCFMASGGDMDTFRTTADRTWLTNEGLYTMNGGESCELNADSNNCAKSKDQVTAQRLTYLNTEWKDTVIAAWKSSSCYIPIANMLGYRFVLIDGDFPASVARSAIYQATVNVRNTGVAPLYNSRPVEVILRNKASQALTTFTQPSSIDPRQWAPGSNVSVTLSFTVPSTLATGSYQVLLNLPDASSTLNQPLNRILFANTVDSNNVQVQDPAGTRYNVISSVNVV